MEESQSANPKRPTMTFSVLADKKISIKIEKVAGAYSSRYTLYCAEDTDFSQTMAHRMGFTREQVANEHFHLRWDNKTSTNGVTYNEAVVHVPMGGNNDIAKISEMIYVDSNRANTVKTWTSYANGIIKGFSRTHISNFIGFESISSHLFLKSDLVTDFVGTYI